MFIEIGYAEFCDIGHEYLTTGGISQTRRRRLDVYRRPVRKSLPHDSEVINNGFPAEINHTFS